MSKQVRIDGSLAVVTFENGEKVEFWFGPEGLHSKRLNHATTDGKHVEMASQLAKWTELLDKTERQLSLL